MWCRIDRKRQGYLTKPELNCDEFRGLVKTLVAPSVGTSMGGAGAPYARAQLNMKETIALCTRKADLNKDGVLSFEEFESFTLAMRRISGTTAVNSCDIIFSLFDLDSDFKIDENEFREMYRFFAGVRPTEMAFQEEWLRLDSKHKGSVTMDEFRDWLRASENPVFKARAPKDAAGEAEFEDLESQNASSAAPDPAAAAAAAKEQARARRHLWKRGGLFCSVGSNVELVAKSLPEYKTTSGRPKWYNSKIDGNITAPVEPKHKRHNPESLPSTMSRSSTEFRLLRPKERRIYFDKTQSMPELVRYLQSAHGPVRVRTTRQQICEKICQPGRLTFERESLPAPKRKGCPESNPVGANYLDLPCVPHRHVAGGTMRDHLTGRPVEWNNHWSGVKNLKDSYVNGSNALRCPGAPPRHLYVDEYYDSGE
jgi:hypothetical protein